MPSAFGYIIVIQEASVSLGRRKKIQKPQKRILDLWSECRDSNPRPLGPEPSAIPNLDKLERAKCSDTALISSGFYNFIIPNRKAECKGYLLFSLAFLRVVDQSVDLK